MKVLTESEGLPVDVLPQLGQPRVLFPPEPLPEPLPEPPPHTGGRAGEADPPGGHRGQGQEQREEEADDGKRLRRDAGATLSLFMLVPSRVEVDAGATVSSGRVRP